MTEKGILQLQEQNVCDRDLVPVTSLININNKGVASRISQKSSIFASKIRVKMLMKRELCVHHRGGHINQWSNFVKDTKNVASLFFIPMTAIFYKVIIHHFKYQYL